MDNINKINLVATKKIKSIERINNTEVSSVKNARNVESFDFDTDLGDEGQIKKIHNYTSDMIDDDIGCKVSDSVDFAISDIDSWTYDVENWWSKAALPVIKDVGADVINVLSRTGATVALGSQSLIEGVGQFGESIVDIISIVGTGVASLVTGLYDGGQAISGLITGDEWDSATKQMWNNTMGFVSEKYVTGWFDKLYNDTNYGRWIKENAIGNEIIRTVGSGVGYVAGIVALTVATFGVGGVVAGSAGAAAGATSAVASTAVISGQMAGVAGVAGIGKGAQDSWADGATLGEGLVSGGLNGVWEGLQFYLGAKIGTTNLFKGSGAKILNSLSRISLDGLDGGAEGVVQPLIASIYKDGYINDEGKYIEFTDSNKFYDKYREIFEDYGSWKNVLTQASIGTIGSSVGEIFGLTDLLKNNNISDDVVQNIVTDELNDIEIETTYLDSIGTLKGIDNVSKYLNSASDIGKTGSSETIVSLDELIKKIDSSIEKLEGEAFVDESASGAAYLDTADDLDSIKNKLSFSEIEDLSSSLNQSNEGVKFLSFSKEYDDAIKELSNYYGDAGSSINYMFLQGKTAKQILDELDGQAKIDFQNFLQNTRQGQYLASLSDIEIRSMTTYTGGSFSEINGMLRKKRIFGIINGIDSQKLIDNMDAAIAKYGGLETPTEIYRAVGVSAFTSQNSTYAALFNGIDVYDLNQVYGVLKVLEGKDFGDLGYMSTSPAYSASFAKYNSCPIVLDIMADEGTSGAYINQISNFYNSENEFLLARDTVLQMVEVLKPERDINGLEKIVIRCVVK